MPRNNLSLFCCQRGSPLALGKIGQFQIVAIRIFEVKSTNTRGGLVGRRDDLRSRRSMAYVVRPQVLVSFIHIGNDDRDMLKRLVVAAPIGRNGSSLGREILCQLEDFRSELHAYDAHAHTEEALQFFILAAIDFEIADLLKIQYLAEELTRAVDSRNGHADGLDRSDELR